MKYAIRHQGSYWYDGAGSTGIYDVAGWLGGKQLVAFLPTVYETREEAERIVGYWFNCNNDRDYTPDPKTGETKKFRVCMINGRAVGQYRLDVDTASKKMVRNLNTGELPEVEEVADFFGRPGWMDLGPEEGLDD